MPRSASSVKLRLLIGAGGFFLLLLGAAWYRGHTHPPAISGPAAVDWHPLPEIPELEPGTVGTTIAERLPIPDAVDTIPASTDEIPPFTIAEVSQLRASVLGHRFDEAEGILRGLAAAARVDVRREHRWRNAYRAGFQALPDTFAQAIDSWVEAHPSAAEPLVARAWNRFWIAYYWRGEGLRVDPARVPGFLNALSHAAIDAERALALDPDQLPAYWVLINVARTEGDHAAVGRLLAMALRRSPTSFDSYATAMVALFPKWGGSLSAMREVGRAAMAGASRNPELRKLGGYAAWQQADQTAGRLTPRSRALLQEALGYGPDPEFYSTFGTLLLHDNRPLEALPYLDSALALEPTLVTALSARRTANFFLHVQTQDSQAATYEDRYRADLRAELLLRPLMEP